jgi:simple sugar transport system permease protein
MDEILGQVLQVGFFAAMIRIATPLLFATIGELFAERSGVLNLGIEGIMLLSAMTGFSAAYFTGSLWLGVSAAILTGVACGALMGLLTVTFGLSQHVSGLGLTLLATGLAFFFFRVIFGQPEMPPNIKAFQTVPIPLLSDIPFLGPVLFDQYALVYFALLLIPAAAFVLYRTPWGLHLRTVGESPHAADSAGVSVPSSPWPSSTPSPSASSPGAAGSASPWWCSASGAPGARLSRPSSSPSSTPCSCASRPAP